jgi:hypothetical protein
VAVTPGSGKALAMGGRPWRTAAWRRRTSGGNPARAAECDGGYAAVLAAAGTAVVGVEVTAIRAGLTNPFAVTAEDSPTPFLFCHSSEILLPTLKSRDFFACCALEIHRKPERPKQWRRSNYRLCAAGIGSVGIVPLREASFVALAALAPSPGCSELGCDPLTPGDRMRTAPGASAPSVAAARAAKSRSRSG